MCPNVPFDDEYRSILRDYGWREDPRTSPETWFPPDGLPLLAISIAKRQGIWCWVTLDVKQNERVGVGPETLEEYLKLYQPDVDVTRK
jgi:hypothetical protein